MMEDQKGKQVYGKEKKTQGNVSPSCLDVTYPVRGSEKSLTGSREKGVNPSADLITSQRPHCPTPHNGNQISV
jgi:hypothetical protein